MSEMSLKQVGNEAKTNYGDYAAAYKKHGESVKTLENDHEDIEVNHVLSGVARNEMEKATGNDAIVAYHEMNDYDEKLEIAKAKIGQSVVDKFVAKADLAKAEQKGKKNFHDNESAYHDAAVIEAHQAGVAIDVEQPLVVGQQVPVRVEHG